MTQIPANELRGVHGPDGAVVLHVNRSRMAGLNPTAHRIWVLLRSGHDVGSVARLLAREYGQDIERCRDDVLECRSALARLGLLDETAHLRRRP